MMKNCSVMLFMGLSGISSICVGSKTWGKEGWKKVDRRGEINSRTLSVITAMSAYQEGCVYLLDLF